MARKSRKNTVPSEGSVNQARSAAYRVAIYARISVEDERKESSDTIGIQVQYCEDFCSKIPEFEIYDVYIDDDLSGSNFNRPNFARMMKDVRDQKVNCIVMKDLSRLGRNFLESGEYLEKVFPLFDLRYIAINDGIDTHQKQIDMGAQLKNMVNEIYAKDISTKIRSTMKTMQEQGKFIGSHPPYGYLRKPEDKYSLMPDPQTAHVIKMIFEMYLEGYTIHGITVKLVDMGISSPAKYKYEMGITKSSRSANTLWNDTTVRKILVDQTYLGWIVNGKYKSQYEQGKKDCVKVPQSEWVIIKGMHEALVDEDTFNKVQLLLAAKRTESPNVGRIDTKVNRANLLRCKLKCGECGAAMFLKKRNVDGEERRWYTCPTHDKFGSEHCPVKAIKMEELNYIVLTLIRKQIRLYLNAENAIRNLNCTPKGQSQYQVYVQQEKSLAEQVERYIRLKADAYSDYAEGILTEKDYSILVSEYAQKVDDLTLLLQAAKRNKLKYSPDYCGNMKWSALVEKFKNPKELTEELVNAFVKKVIVYGYTMIEVEFNFQDECEGVIYQASQRKSEV